LTWDCIYLWLKMLFHFKNRHVFLAHPIHAPVDLIPWVITCT